GWSGQDALSGIASCETDGSYGGPEHAALKLTGTCTDKAGNPGVGVYRFGYDTTPPAIAFVGRTPPNAAGWSNGDVNLTWSCSDALSGTPAATTRTVSAEGANQSVTGTCTDAAGNTASNTQTG